MISDNSESMQKDMKKMDRKFRNFLSLISDLDYHVGVITTDMTREAPGYFGSLDLMDGKSITYITPKTPNKDALFLKTVKRKETRNCFSPKSDCGASMEQPMHASIMAMKKRNTNNIGFFRDDAKLAILTVSDEDEKGNGSFNPKEPKQVLERAQIEFGPKKVVKGYGIIVQPGDKKCWRRQGWDFFLGLGASYGKRVDELARLTGGVTSSICEKDFTDGLREITANMRQNLVYKEITLERTPIAGSVQVTLSPAQNISWKLDGNKIVFSRAPSENTQITVVYKYQN